MSETRDRLNSIIDQKIKQSPDLLQPDLSVAGLAKSAKLSRTTLYRHYPEIVARLRNLRGDEGEQRRNDADLKLRLLRNQLASQRQLLSALARSCAELLAEIVELKQDLVDQAEAHVLRTKVLEKQISDQSRVVSLHRRK